MKKGYSDLKTIKGADFINSEGERIRNYSLIGVDGVAYASMDLADSTIIRLAISPHLIKIGQKWADRTYKKFVKSGKKYLRRLTNPAREKPLSRADYFAMARGQRWAAAENKKGYGFVKPKREDRRQHLLAARRLRARGWRVNPRRRNPVGTSEHASKFIGHKLSFEKGWGYWDITRYPYGGDFHRFKGDEAGAVLPGKAVKMPGEEIAVLLDNGSTIICPVQAIKRTNPRRRNPEEGSLGTKWTDSHGIPHLDFTQAKLWCKHQPDHVILYMMRDCRAAIAANPTAPKSQGFYEDCILTGSDELYRRRLKR